MIGSMVLWGLSLPWLLVLCLLSWLLLWPSRRLLARVGFYRWVWHPALFDAGLFVLLLWGVSVLSARIVS